MSKTTPSEFDGVVRLSLILIPRFWVLIVKIRYPNRAYGEFFRKSTLVLMTV